MEFTQEHLDIIKNSARYKDFTICKPAKRFCEMPEFDKDIAVVQLHSLEIFGQGREKSIVGFCGCFEWKHREIISLDGDDYTKEMPVFGYEWLTTEDEGLCLDILVGNEW